MPKRFAIGIDIGGTNLRVALVSEEGEIVRKIKTEVESIALGLNDLPSRRVFWEVGSRPLVGAGGKSFANEFIRYAGGGGYTTAPCTVRLINNQFLYSTYATAFLIK